MVGQLLKYLEKVSEFKVALMRMSLRSARLGKRSFRMTKRKSLRQGSETKASEGGIVGERPINITFVHLVNDNV